MKVPTGGLALLCLLIASGETFGQVLPPPFPPPPPPVVVSGNGFNFIYARRNLLVAGSVGTRIYSTGYPLDPYVGWGYPVAPYGIQQNRITIQYIQPAPVVIGGLRAPDPTAGVDLDEVPIKKAAPPPRPEPRDEAPPPKVEPKPPEPEPAVKLPGVDVSKPRPVVRPDDPEVKPQPKPEPEPEVKPKAEPPRVEQFPDEASRMVHGGLTAFQDGRYGLAALRFIQAAELNKADGKARFLLGQAQFALGKYADAIVAIEEGLKLEKDWPTAPFKPRAELYKGTEADLDAQLKRLEDVLARNPNDATFGFLLAYQYWFDGRRDEAVALFRRVRPMAADPVFIDSFLKAAGPAVAAR